MAKEAVPSKQEALRSWVLIESHTSSVQLAYHNASCGRRSSVICLQGRSSPHGFVDQRAKISSIGCLSGVGANCSDACETLR